MHSVIVSKGRTKVLRVMLNEDVTGDTFTSEIREEPKSSSPIIAAWTITVDGSPTLGKLILTLPSSTTSGVTKTKGYMDIKRVSGGVVSNVFDGVLVVEFLETVTA